MRLKNRLHVIACGALLALAIEDRSARGQMAQNKNHLLSEKFEIAAEHWLFAEDRHRVGDLDLRLLNVADSVSARFALVCSGVPNTSFIDLSLAPGRKNFEDFQGYRIELFKVMETSWPLHRSRAILSVQEKACSDEEFSKVPTPSWESNPCSPKIDRLEWSGILIRAPQAATSSRVPLIGRWRLPEQGSAPIEQKMWLVAKNAQDAVRAPLADFFSLQNPISLPDEPGVSRHKSLITGGWFNIDIGPALAIKPGESSQFQVHMESGTFRSNAVRIEVHRPKD